MMKEFGKIITAMVTPLNENLNLDLKAIEPLVKHLEDTGTETLVLAGTTGEGPTIEEREKLDLLSEVYKHKNKLTKIIMNVGTNNTKETVRNAIKWSENEMVDGIMVVCPYYNKPSQTGLYKHFESVNDAVSKPIMAYHIPGRTNVTMNTETMVKVANLSNVVMLKDAEGDLEKLQDVIKQTEGKWDVYSGDDPALFNYLEIGSKGIVSVASHVIGDVINSLIEAYENKSYDSAKDLQSFIKEISEQLFPSFSPNPVPVKYVLSKMGLMNEQVRLPLTELSASEKEQILNVLHQQQVFKQTNHS
ncbi:4-hydroxy-tetrahydrodipicolinate synthase [Priestia aryabhattai]|uniref:4-hydroxy-tetrahydrodipicolinate synthase n=1 Tax=Priestia aryabhattai TaxID=412384 RepID=A0AAX6NC97_PRIAR|nr:4-hydroxy-tetrahydrodipicolinate synthase [Priestia aryabhattai]MDU9693543.1 4-hydroxy-tetrahydrodipicolinate synthase [Priestia aryabhattai]